MLPLLVLVPAPVVAQVPFRPLWISVLPIHARRVYAVGAAPLGADAAALRQASDNARAEVVTRLRASVKAETRITTVYQESRASNGAPGTASRSQNAQVATVVQAQAADLPGLVVDETYLDRPGGTAYALAYLDLAIAEEALRSRLAALQAQGAAEGGEQGVRAKLVEAQALIRRHAELEKLDDLAALVSGGGGASQIRADVLECRLDTERRMAAARGALTFGLAPAQGLEVDPELEAAVRNAVLKAGMGWSGQKPLFSLILRTRSAAGGDGARQAWWDRQRTPDFTVAQGALTLSLSDATGQEYESMLIQAKGVGTSEAQADTQLLADVRAKLAKAVAKWLEDLGSW